MKIAMVMKRLPFFGDVCDRIAENREKFCSYWGMEFIYDCSLDFPEDRHWSFCHPLSVLKVLKERKDIDWVLSTTPTYLCMDLDFLYVDPDSLKGELRFVFPLFEMYNPDAPYYYENLRGDLKRCYTDSPSPFVSFCGTLFKRDSYVIGFLERLVQDERFTRGIFVEPGVSNFVSCEALTIYFLGYPEYRPFVRTVKMDSITALPKYGHPRHLVDVGKKMPVYDEKERNCPLLYVTGCGLKPGSALNIIESHEEFVK